MGTPREYFNTNIYYHYIFPTKLASYLAIYIFNTSHLFVYYT